jgi:hypothetical protein
MTFTISPLWTSAMQWKKQNTTLWDQIQHLIKKSFRKSQKSILLTHIYMTTHFPSLVYGFWLSLSYLQTLLGTGTSVISFMADIKPFIVYSFWWHFINIWWNLK